MRKTILLFFSVFLMGFSAMTFAQSDKDNVEMQISATSIVVNGATISIHNADGQLLEVFSLTGNKLTSIRIEGNEKNINLPLKKGCYILKVNNVVRKISIR